MYWTNFLPSSDLKSFIFFAFFFLIVSWVKQFPYKTEKCYNLNLKRLPICIIRVIGSKLLQKWKLPRICCKIETVNTEFFNMTPILFSARGCCFTCFLIEIMELQRPGFRDDGRAFFIVVPPIPSKEYLIRIITKLIFFRGGRGGGGGKLLLRGII